MQGGQDDPADPEFEGFYGPCGAIRHHSSFEIEPSSTSTSLPSRMKEKMNNNNNKNNSDAFPTAWKRDNNYNGDIQHIKICCFPFESWCHFSLFLLSLVALGYIAFAVATISHSSASAEEAEAEAVP